MPNVPNPSRRSLFKYLAATIGSIAAPAADSLPPIAPHDASYQITDQRELPGGGVGLFIVVGSNPSSDDLRDLGERLHRQFRGEPNVAVVVFDDLEAAKTVRTGSRIVGDELFEAAKAHQKASYAKNARSGREFLTILGDTLETVTY